MQRRAFCGRSNTMLDRDFAEKFIDRVTRYTDYNVNIMDERGIIIASRDKARIGQYHEVAYRLVTGTEEIVDTTGMSFPNVLPGINMVIATGGVREGVVGVTGRGATRCADGEDGL